MTFGEQASCREIRGITQFATILQRLIANMFSQKQYLRGAGGVRCGSGTVEGIGPASPQGQEADVMKSFSIRISVAALAVLVTVGLAACMNPFAGSTGGAKSGSVSVSSNGAINSRSAMPATSSQGGTVRIVCDELIYNNVSLPVHHWKGPLEGCALKGATVEFWEKKTQNYVVGKTEHFFEKMRISIGGDTITGDDAGVWNFSTFKYRANGWVTGATGKWAYLTGYKVHEVGYTTEVPPPADDPTVTGTGTLWLAP